MKREGKFSLAAGVVLSAMTLLSCESPTDPAVDAISFGRGNGIEDPGAHYNLNIIGVPFEKTPDMTGDNGHRIFVLLNGKTRIDLYKDEDFGVIDADGTDRYASFQLPAPDPNGDGTTDYSVYLRWLGKPGGGSGIVACATYVDPVTMEEQYYCPSDITITLREKGRPIFKNADDDLLYVYFDTDGDGTVEKLPLFDDDLQDIFWTYDNRGLRLLQMRFYMNG